MKVIWHRHPNRGIHGVIKQINKQGMIIVNLSYAYFLFTYRDNGKCLPYTHEDESNSTLEII